MTYILAIFPLFNNPTGITLIPFSHIVSLKCDEFTKTISALFVVFCKATLVQSVIEKKMPKFEFFAN